MNIQISIIHKNRALNSSVHLRLCNPDVWWDIPGKNKPNQKHKKEFTTFCSNIIMTVWWVCLEARGKCTSSMYVLKMCQSFADPWWWPEGRLVDMKISGTLSTNACGSMRTQPPLHRDDWQKQQPQSACLKKHLTRICIANPRHVIMKVSTVFKEDMMESSKP